MTVAVDRAQVLAYRVAAHGLDRQADRAAVLDLGVQDTPPGSARLALVARTNPPHGEPRHGPLSMAWTVRGAPHLHPSAHLEGLAAALWPLSDTDALARVAWQRSRLRDVGMGALEALAEVVTAMRAAVTATMAKGAASAAVTERLPESLTAWCRPCGSRHVFESVFRLAALPAGLRLEPDLTPAHLTPIAGWTAAATPALAAGTDRLVRTYLRFLGPAEAAGFLGTTRTQLRQAWPGELAEVRVDGRPAWLPEPDVAALRAAPRPRLVRLLPPSDPYLQARDRDLLVPDRAAQRTLWTALGQPGALLVDGEIAGVWRPRTSGRTLRITVTPFGSAAAKDRAALTAEAEAVAAARGAAKVDVVVDAD